MAEEFSVGDQIIKVSHNSACCRASIGAKGRIIATKPLASSTVYDVEYDLDWFGCPHDRTILYSAQTMQACFGFDPDAAPANEPWADDLVLA